MVTEWCKANPDVLEQWKKDNPKAKPEEELEPEAAPDAVAVQFFATFAAKHPKAFPALTDGKPAAVRPNGFAAISPYARACHAARAAFDGWSNTATPTTLPLTVPW